jgi:hypothetical protein
MVDIERTFRFGRDYVTTRRHNLHQKLVSRGMALVFYSQKNKIKPLALHQYMEKKKNQAVTGGSGSGSQSVAVVVPIDD